MSQGEELQAVWEAELNRQIVIGVMANPSALKNSADATGFGESGHAFSGRHPLK